MNESEMTLASDWNGQNLSGWLISEKLNGCRAYWDGSQFWTRGGNVINAPKWFTRSLPDVHLDGEIWAGRTGFEAARVAVEYGDHWFDSPGLEFVAFDFPGLVATWDKRIAEAAKALKGSIHRAVDFFQIKPRCRSYWQLTDFLRRIRPLGGEGACMRNPEVTFYETGRSENLLRFKFYK